ncbi:MAG: DUF177 domain-containing protein [Candidatus Margulisbacteria bacterium]|nr:DUF177 domain-containing protein [Candidatus Margulisiibacteriota bacterium]MBU1616736.1 DUF177 domain-containing protein [Candidatus Margulisiibacteriota bacterium]MBU1867253.1 DUF177 domain-containing protein [Candidatus Margulisiibacteriota bacterium]
MKIELTELLRQVGNEGDVEDSEKLSFPEDGLILTKPVLVRLHLTNTGNSVLVKGTIQAEAELECSRCLNSFKQPITLEVSETYARQDLEQSVGKETELKESDFVYPIEKDNTIDLNELIRQNILLSLPIKSLCDNNCKGV